MSQTSKIGKTATKVIKDNDGLIRVRYHNTDVVTVSPNGSIALDSGGWWTATTKLRMNQASNQLNLGFSVYQEKVNWFVTFEGATIPYTNRWLVLER